MINGKGKLGKIILPKVKDVKIYEILKDMGFFAAGSILYSISVTVFTAPNRIAPGGITGISTVLHYLFGTPLGVMMFVLNIPLFLVALKLIGGKFIVKTVICTALISVFTDVLSFMPVYHDNLILAALYGGVLEGIGLALIFLRGGTTGGTDVASRLLKLRYPYVPMGRMMMLIDAFIIVSSAVAFRSVNSALYAIIAIFTSTKVIDSILYGADTGRMVLVISDRSDDIAQTVMTELDRGVTMLRGRGYYTGREREVLMCAVRRPEAARLRAIVRKADPSAFIIMCEAGEVIGEGFKPIGKET